MKAVTLVISWVASVAVALPTAQERRAATGSDVDKFGLYMEVLSGPANVHNQALKIEVATIAQPPKLITYLGGNPTQRYGTAFRLDDSGTLIIGDPNIVGDVGYAKFSLKGASDGGLSYYSLQPLIIDKLRPTDIGWSTTDEPIPASFEFGGENYLRDKENKDDIFFYCGEFEVGFRGASNFRREAVILRRLYRTAYEDNVDCAQVRLKRQTIPDRVLEDPAQNPQILACLGEKFIRMSGRLI